MKTNRTKGTLIKRGGIWQAVWVAGGKKYRKSTGVGDKKKAKDIMRDLVQPFTGKDEVEALQRLSAVIAGRQAEVEALDDKLHPPTAVNEAWGLYLRAGNRKEISPGTQANYMSYWTSFTKWLGEESPDIRILRDVTFQHAEGYISSLFDKKVTGRTMNAHRAFLRAFWNVMTERARLEGNPWVKIAKRDEHSMGRRALTVEELRKVCGAATGELRILLALGLYLGARLGDCAMMDWGSVDMVRRVVRYAPRKTARKAPSPMLVPMHPELHAVLSEIPPARRNGPVCPELADRYSRRGADGVSDLVQKHFTVCKLTTTVDRTGSGIRKSVSVGFHSMRHTAVSLLREAGAAQSISQALVGHSSPEVHALYTHTDETAMRRAVGTIPNVLGMGSDADDPLQALQAKVRKIAERMTAETVEAAKTDLQALPRPNPVEALKAKVAEIVDRLAADTLDTVKAELLALGAPKKPAKLLEDSKARSA